MRSLAAKGRVEKRSQNRIQPLSFDRSPSIVYRGEIIEDAERDKNYTKDGESVENEGDGAECTEENIEKLLRVRPYRIAELRLGLTCIIVRGSWASIISWSLENLEIIRPSHN